MTPGSGTPMLDGLESGIGKAAVKGSIIGFFVVGIASTLIALGNDAELGSSLAIGAFAGFWGGPGFGGMLGATLTATRAEQKRNEQLHVAREQDNSDSDAAAEVEEEATTS